MAQPLAEPAAVATEPSTAPRVAPLPAITVPARPGDPQATDDSHHLVSTFRDRASADEAYAELRSLGIADDDILMTIPAALLRNGGEAQPPRAIAANALYAAAMGALLGGSAGAALFMAMSAVDPFVVPVLRWVILGPGLGFMIGGGAGALVGGGIGAIATLALAMVSWRPRPRPEAHEVITIRVRARERFEQTGAGHPSTE